MRIKVNKTSTGMYYGYIQIKPMGIVPVKIMSAWIADKMNVSIYV